MSSAGNEKVNNYIFMQFIIVEKLKEKLAAGNSQKHNIEF